MRRASLAEGLAGRPLALHSDNGSPMKGATMLATLQWLGIVWTFAAFGEEVRAFLNRFQDGHAETLNGILRGQNTLLFV